jgi:uncharacterized membrane protein YgcG
VKATLLTAAVLAALGLSTAGCGTDGSYDKDFFPSGERQADKIEHAQIAAGARADATLSAAHFDDGSLNSLGQQKLDLITATLPDEGPMTIYVDLPADGTFTQARKDAVTAYLIDSHLTADQFKLVDGPNNNTWTPSAAALVNMSKTETDTTGAASASSNGAGSAGGASTAGGASAGGGASSAGH